MKLTAEQKSLIEAVMTYHSCFDITPDVLRRIEKALSLIFDTEGVNRGRIIVVCDTNDNSDGSPYELVVDVYSKSKASYMRSTFTMETKEVTFQEMYLKEVS